MSVLPAAKSTVLRWTLVALAAACLLVAFRDLHWAIAGQPLFGAFAIVFWVPLAIGLWLLNPIARSIAMAVLWLVVIFIPLGIVNPFAAMDELGPNPPPVWELLAYWVAPWVVPAIIAIHVLGKHKGEFRWRRESAA